MLIPPTTPPGALLAWPLGLRLPLCARPCGASWLPECVPGRSRSRRLVYQAIAVAGGRSVSQSV